MEIENAGPEHRPSEEKSKIAANPTPVSTANYSWTKRWLFFIGGVTTTSSHDRAWRLFLDSLRPYHGFWSLLQALRVRIYDLVLLFWLRLSRLPLLIPESTPIRGLKGKQNRDFKRDSPFRSDDHLISACKSLLRHLLNLRVSHPITTPNPKA